MEITRYLSNFLSKKTSLSDKKGHGETLERIREAAKLTKVNCAIMLDTKVFK